MVADHYRAHPPCRRQPSRRQPRRRLRFLRPFFSPSSEPASPGCSSCFTGNSPEHALNAWDSYRGEPHYSIGASTAVFGARGLLSGTELWARWAPRSGHPKSLAARGPARRRARPAGLPRFRRQKRADRLHGPLLGLLTGLPLGWLAAALKLRPRLSPTCKRSGRRSAALLAPNPRAAARGLGLSLSSDSR